jgi:WD40 repeat protein
VWDAASGKELRVLRGHEGYVNAAGFSQDGARIVSGSYDDTVRVWDAASGQELLTLRGHEGPVRAVGFSREGARIVSGSYDQTVRVWDASSGKEPLILRGHQDRVLAAMKGPSMPGGSRRMARASSVGQRTRRFGCGTRRAARS